MCKSIIKRRPRIIFEFEKLESGFNIITKTKGDVVDAYIYGIQKLINEKIKIAENGKNRRR